MGAVQPSEVSEDRVKVRITPDGRMTRRDTAKYIGVAEKTLAMWQLAGKGPQSIKIGGRRFYYLEVVDKFIASAGAAVCWLLIFFAAFALSLVGWAIA